MEKLTIEKWQAKAIENVLRLTHNIYRADITTGETNYDRQLKKSTKFIRDVLATSNEPCDTRNCGCTTCDNLRKNI
jgi:hypothetical protein